MENTTAEQPGTVALEPPSTVLNPETVKGTSGGGKVDISTDKGNSIQDVLEKELANLKDADAKAEAEAKDKGQQAVDDAKAKVEDKEKAEKDAKPEADKAKARDESGKFAKAEKTEDQPEKADKGAAEKPATERSAPDDRQSEGRKHAEPPARFLPEARTKWANVPNEVKAEFHRVSQEYEAEIAKGKETTERYDRLREYDDIAKSNGRDLKDSLARVVQVEQAIARNPIAGLDAILREIGPRKADGSPLTLMEVAQHIVQNPQAYQQARQMPQPVQQQNDNPEVKALLSEVQELKTQMVWNSQIQPMLTAFEAKHTDFPERWPQMQAIIQSGVIDQLYGNGLTPEQRLSEAYRMAGGNPPSRSESEPVQQHSAPSPDRPVNPDAGKKSVRGAPSDGADTAVDEPETDLREMLRKEYRKIA
jgi:hypothetical protein